MQKRERLLAGAVAVLVGGWLIDGVAVQPARAWFAATDQTTQAAIREVGEAHVLIDRQSRILADWRTRHAAGLNDNEDQARFRLQRTLQDAAKTSDFTIASVGDGQLVPASQNQVYDLLRLSVSGHGALEQVQLFVSALESAAMPLKIERCELSSGDARKDALEAALTLSTRLVGENERASRGVPDGTTPWAPEKRDRTLDLAIKEGKPFLADRRHSVAQTPGDLREEPALATTTPTSTNKAGWALVGIVAGDRETLAFVRHVSDSKERLVRTGDQLDGQEVLGVERSGLRLRLSDGELLIAVGQDLTGQAIDSAITTASSQHNQRESRDSRDTRDTRSSSTPTVSPAAAAAPFQIPTIPTDPAREAILQRLRQQRNRAP